MLCGVLGGSWLIGAESGMATGLMIVLNRPSETSPTVPPSPLTVASALTAPRLAVKEDW